MFTPQKAKIVQYMDHMSDTQNVSILFVIILGPTLLNNQQFTSSLLFRNCNVYNELAYIMFIFNNGKFIFLFKPLV